ncbi:hypothetical protein [Spiroplasma poulsonii]|uniref:hypothetical protein n=1 Tax=Spiroplasma poulsonii TaxID=2138 RepID=UPI001F4CBCE2|nr:hypothetical protein [Spiroplasma poulsonii]UNF61712.1 hypothetical protein MNU24_07325 [Spiroplasma poulsonii]
MVDIHSRECQANGDLGTLTINDMNQFVIALSQGILDNADSLTKVSQISWSDPNNQEQNQTEIAKLLTGSADPTKPAAGSFMDVAFTWFNDGHYVGREQVCGYI